MSVYVIKDFADEFHLLCEAGGPLELLADHVRDGDPNGVLVDAVHFDEQVLSRLRDIPDGEDGHITRDPDGTLFAWFHERDNKDSDPLGCEIFVAS